MEPPDGAAQMAAALSSRNDEPRVRLGNADPLAKMWRGKYHQAADKRPSSGPPSIVAPSGPASLFELQDVLQAVQKLETVVCDRLDRLEARLASPPSSAPPAILAMVKRPPSPRPTSRTDGSPGAKDSFNGEESNGQATDTSVATGSQPREGSYVNELRQGTDSEFLQSLAALDKSTLVGRLKSVVLRWGRWLDWIAVPVIVVNTILVGVEIQHSLDGHPVSDFTTAEHFFLTFFIIELGIRAIVNQEDYRRSGWFVLDASCVIVGVGFDWIVWPTIRALQASDDAAGAGIIGRLDLLKTFRLLRLTRSLRLLEMCKDLWSLTSGLFSAARTVTSACILLFMAIYIFSCVLIEMMNQSEELRTNPEIVALIDERFNHLLRTILTLWSFTNGDNLADVYEPLITQDPFFAPVFIILWIVISVALMNLVTAVIVDSAIERQKSSDETKRNDMRKKVKLLTPHIETLFDELDGSGDGAIEVAELTLKNVHMPKELKHIITEDKLKDLFQFLDMDGSGTVERDEFVDGIMHLTLQSVPIETTQTLQLLRAQQKVISEIHRRLCG